MTSLPGACACITALTLSGLPTRRFCFEAFLPADKKERQEILEELKTETRTIILYEAPHRLIKTLKELLITLGDRRITLCRELTKRHETVFGTTLLGALEFYETQEPKGETAGLGTDGTVPAYGSLSESGNGSEGGHEGGGERSRNREAGCVQQVVGKQRKSGRNGWYFREILKRGIDCARMSLTLSIIAENTLRDPVYRRNGNRKG